MNEKYIFKFTVGEIKEMNKEINKEITTHTKAICLQVLFAFVFVVLLFLSLISRMVSDVLHGFFIGALLIYTLMLIYSYIQNKRFKKMEFNRIAGNTYQYEFFEDYVLVTISDETSSRVVEIKYSDITSVKKCKTLYRIDYSKVYYFLREKDLLPNAKIKSM